MINTIAAIYEKKAKETYVKKLRDECAKKLVAEYHSVFDNKIPEKTNKANTDDNSKHGSIYEEIDKDLDALISKGLQNKEEYKALQQSINCKLNKTLMKTFIREFETYPSEAGAKGIEEIMISTLETIISEEIKKGRLPTLDKKDMKKLSRKYNKQISQKKRFEECFHPTYYVRLLFDLTAFMTYMNLLILFIHHGKEDLLYYLAGNIIEPLTQTSIDGTNDTRVAQLFLWLRQYVSLLLLEAKMREKAVISSQVDQSGKVATSSLEDINNRIRLLFCQFNYQDNLNLFMIDFTKSLYDLGAQQPSTQLHDYWNNMALNPGDDLNSISWYSTCIAYFQNMKFLRGDI